MQITNRSSGVQPTIGGSVYLKPQDMTWKPTRYDGVSIKVLYENKNKGELTCLLKWDPGTTLPMHKHPGSRPVLYDRRLVLRPRRDLSRRRVYLAAHWVVP